MELSHNVDYRDVIPDEIDRMRRHTHYQFIAFSPNRKLVEKTNRKFKYFLDKYAKMYHHIFPNPFGTIPPAVRIVPLYEFATSPVIDKQLDDQEKRPKSFFLKLLHLIFIVAADAEIDWWWNLGSLFGYIKPTKIHIYSFNNNSIPKP